MCSDVPCTLGKVDLVLHNASFCSGPYIPESAPLRCSGWADIVLISCSVPGEESLEWPLARTSIIFWEESSFSLSVMLFCGWLPLSAWKNLHLFP